MSDQIAYTVRQAADAVGLSQDTIRKAVTAEALPAKDLRSPGSQLPAIRIGHDDLVRWFQAQADYEPPNGGR